MVGGDALVSSSIIPGWPRFQALWVAAGHIGYGTSWASYEDMRWIDVTSRFIRQWNLTIGRQYELDQNQTGTLTSTWVDTDSAFDPLNVLSPFYPQVLPYQPFRLRAQYPGVVPNLLTVDQATCGQGTPYSPGSVPSTFNVSNDFGYTLSLAASASAYVGNQVYQVSIPSGAGQYTTVLLLGGLAVTPNVSYAATAQVRINTAGVSGPLDVAILWYDANGTFITASGGAQQTVTGGSTTWVTVTANGTAPAGAVIGKLKVELSATSTGTAVYQVGGLQWEVGTAASPWAIPGSAPINMLTVDQATCGQGTPWPIGIFPTAFGLDLNGVSFFAWQTVTPNVTPTNGPYACEVQLAEADQFADLFLTRVPVTPGVTYSFQIQARCTTAGQSPAVAASIQWYGAPFGDDSATFIAQSLGTTTTLTGATAPAWTTLTVSATAPAGTYFALISVTNPNAAITVNTNLQGASMQFEANAVPRGWVTPSPWYTLMTGGVERYPSALEFQGTYSERQPTIVDTFALLSQSKLPDPFTAAVMTPANGSAPSLYYKLGEPSGSSSFADATGNRGTAVVNSSKAGGGTVAPGTAQTSASPSGGFAGAPGETVTTFSSTAPAGTGTYGQPMSWIALPNAAGGSIGPANGTGRGFTRMIAFRCTTAPTVAETLWIAQDASGTDIIGMFLNTGGNFTVEVEDGVNNSPLNNGTYDIGNWHLAWLGVAADGNSFICGIDNNVSGFLTSAPYNPTRGFAFDAIGAAINPNDVRSGIYNFAGDIAFACEWPFELTTSQISTIYTAWKTAFAGDSSGQRYQRILGWAGWTGPALIENGASTNLSAATGLQGTDALSALQAVVDTEGGNHFVRSDGVLVFRARTHRWGVNTPQVTFGELASAGEIGYEGDLAADYDPTQIINDAEVTQASTNQVFVATDTTGVSQAQYGTRPKQLTSLSASASECQDRAWYLVSRYQTPRPRYSTLTVHLSAQPAAWAAILGLGLDTRVRVNRRPPAPAYSSQFDGWLESANWSGDDKGTLDVTYQISQADPSPFILFAALTTQLASPANAGATSLTLQALSDAAWNRAESYFYLGQQIVVGANTSGAQTVTVTALPSTQPGYTTFTLGVSALGASAAAGLTVSEALPGSQSTFIYNGASYALPGPTDPHTWDVTTSTFVLDASQLDVNELATAGTFDYGVFAY
jgi:hypothetical protein